MPRQVISDRDKKWTGAFWKELTAFMGSKRALTTAHHPQADGQTEIVNQVLEVGLRTFVGPLRNDWASKIASYQHAYNSLVHASTGFAPAYLLYGFLPKDPENLLSGHVPAIPRVQGESLDAEEFAEGMKAIRSQAHDALRFAQVFQQRAYNRGRLELEFEEGDLVLLNPHSMKMVKDLKGKGKKLLPKYDGPFEILRKLSPVTYYLRLPGSYKIHPIINVAHLERYRKSPDESGERATREMNREDFDELPEWEVDRIVDERVRKRGRRHVREYRI